MNTSEQVISEFFRLVQTGEVGGITKLLSDDITWIVPGPSLIPYAGTYHGKSGVTEFFRILFAHEELLSFVPDEFIVDKVRDVVCVLGSETAVAIETGKRFSARWAEVFRVADRRITAFEEYIDTFALAEAYKPSNRPLGHGQNKD